MLREDIRRVVNPGDFFQLKVSCTKSILYPEIGGGQMPDLPEAPAATGTDRRSGVGEDNKVKVEPEVIAQRLEANALG